jgi:rubredoxin
MTKVARFVIWICSKFTRKEIEFIINGLVDVLNNRNPEVKPKDDFKQKHPQYRSFSIDPQPPLTENPTAKPQRPSKHYKLMLAEYEALHGKPLKPVKRHQASPMLPSSTVCPQCCAPHEYLYYNDGQQRSQIRCKVCGHLFLISLRFRQKKLNSSAPIVIMPCLSGKSARTLLSINAVMMPVHTVSRTLTNLMLRSVFCAQTVLRNLSSAINTVSTALNPTR